MIVTNGLPFEWHRLRSLVLSFLICNYDSYGRTRSRQTNIYGKKNVGLSIETLFYEPISFFLAFRVKEMLCLRNSTLFAFKALQYIVKAEEILPTLHLECHATHIETRVGLWAKRLKVKFIVHSSGLFLFDSKMTVDSRVTFSSHTEVSSSSLSVSLPLYPPSSPLSLDVCPTKLTYTCFSAYVCLCVCVFESENKDNAKRQQDAWIHERSITTRMLVF